MAITPDLALDSDVAVDFLRGLGDAMDLVSGAWDRIALPAIVVAELYAGVRGATESRVLGDLVRSLPVLPLTAEIANDAGLLKGRYGPSHSLAIADAIVAATARAHGLALLTLNTRHYPMFPGLAPPYRKP